MIFNVECDIETLEYSLPIKWEKLGLRNNEYSEEFYRKYKKNKQKDKIYLIKKEHNKLISFYKDIQNFNEIKKKRNTIIKNLKELENQLKKELLKKNIDEIKKTNTIDNIKKFKNCIKALRDLNFEYIKTYFKYDDIFKFADNNLLIKNFDFEPFYINNIITDCNFLNESKINDNKILNLFFKKNDPFFFSCENILSIDKNEIQQMKEFKDKLSKFHLMNNNVNNVNNNNKNILNNINNDKLEDKKDIPEEIIIENEDENIWHKTINFKLLNKSKIFKFENKYESQPYQNNNNDNRNFCIFNFHNNNNKNDNNFNNNHNNDNSFNIINNNVNFNNVHNNDNNFNLFKINDNFNNNYNNIFSNNHNNVNGFNILNNNDNFFNNNNDNKNNNESFNNNKFNFYNNNNNKNYFINNK